MNTLLKNEFCITKNPNNMYKLKLYQQLGLSVFIFTLYGCAIVGTKTIYRTDNIPQLHKVGYCDLYAKDTLNSIFPETSAIFNSTITEIFNIYGLSKPEKIGFIVAENKKSISDFCEKHSIDALLFTDLRFISVTYMFYFAPIAHNLDTEVKMRLYDMYGNLLYSTKHDTFKGNSYFTAPSTDRTVRDGIRGAFKQIAKEMRLKAIK